MAPQIRALRLTLLAALVGLGACDTLFGPDATPASIEITASRTAMSMVGDSALLEAVVRNSGGDKISDATVTWTSREPGVAQVSDDGILMAHAIGQAWVVGESGVAIDSVLFTVTSPIPCLPEGNLAVPDTVNNATVLDACGPEARYIDVWRLAMSQQRVITIDLSSSDFNTYLALIDANGNLIAADNDGGPGLNSRLLLELPAGVYYPIVGPYSVGIVGDYQLTTMFGAHPSPCPASDTVVFPDTVTGTTRTGACDYQGFYIDVWRLNLADTTRITLELTSAETGMYMAITDTIGGFLTSGGDGPHSGGWLDATFGPGSYDLWVGARGSGVQADYTLQLKQGPATLECPREGSIGVNASVNENLSDDDCWVWYRPSDGWTLDLADTVDLHIAMTTGDPVYPAMLIADSTGRVIHDDYASERYMRLDTVMVPGTYTLWVQNLTAGPDDSTDYNLSVVEAGKMGACDPVGGLTLDSTYEGALSTTDCALLDGRYTDVWRLQLDSATTTTIDITSDKFDAYLIVADTAGDGFARDDDSGDGLNASITLDLAAGTYDMWVTSYTGGSIGGYNITAATAVAAAADRIGPAPHDGTDPSKRVNLRPAWFRTDRLWPGDGARGPALIDPSAPGSRALPEWLAHPGG